MLTVGNTKGNKQNSETNIHNYDYNNNAEVITSEDIIVLNVLQTDILPSKLANITYPVHQSYNIKTVEVVNGGKLCKFIKKYCSYVERTQEHWRSMSTAATTDLNIRNQKKVQ